MLDGLKTLSLSGLGMLGGGILKPIAKRPLLSLADWHGITFESYRSPVSADAIRALGATPTDTLGGLAAGLDDGSIHGYARSLLTYELNGNEDQAPFVTANVNLWPNMIVLLANPASLARLTDEQRGWLHQAAADAAAGSRSLVDREDQIVPAVCQAGGHLANASDADLAALRQAFGPVYSRLEQDPQTKSFIEQIRSLKQSLAVNPPLTIPADCAAPASTPSVAPSPTDPLAGTWVTAKITESQFVRAYVAAGGAEKDGHELFGARHFLVVRLEFQDGLFREYGSADGVPTGLANEGRYTIEGDGTFTLRTGCTERFGYKLAGDVLQLSYLPPFCPDDGRPIGQTLYTSFPFARSNEPY
ncbi:MAG TPA: hypothetical protein VIM24_01760 [Candidatus Limnocylindrales bacterium]